MSISIEVLFIDDEEHLRRATSQTLELAGFPVRTTESTDDVLATVSRSWRGIIVSDIRMPGMDGLELLRRINAIDQDLPVVLVTGHGDVNLAVDAMREGAYDFIEKPFDTVRFLDSVVRAMEKRQLTLENRALRDNIADRPDDLGVRLAGRSNLMNAARKQMRSIATTTSDVLIVGETGTGKEIAARAIHDLSNDKERPFIAINCAALPDQHIEQELFGHEAGGIPGMPRGRFGKLELARNGTVFLDQVQAMSPALQAKLLTVVQSRAITRLGGTEAIPLNCRFIGASTIDLEHPAPQSSTLAAAFSPDLLYRLNVFTLRMPTLESRLEDIPHLFIQLVTEAGARLRTTPPTPSEALLAHISQAKWPGNIRELRNAAERFALGIEEASEPEKTRADLRDRVAAFEREAIAAELQARRGNLKAVYENLGLSRKALYEKMQKYDLERSSFKETDI